MNSFEKTKQTKHEYYLAHRKQILALASQKRLEKRKEYLEWKIAKLQDELALLS